MNKLFYSFLLLVSINSFSQKETLLMSSFDSLPIYDELFHFLLEENEVSIEDFDGVFISLRELLRRDDVVGVYSFRIAGAHSKHYLFMLNSNGNKIFIRNYNVSNVISKYNQFIRKNKIYLNNELQIDYLKAISLILKSRILTASCGTVIIHPNSSTLKNKK